MTARVFGPCAGVALALSSALACMPAPVRVDVPPLDGAASAVYAIERDDGEAVVQVADLTTGAGAILPELARADGEALRIHALHYACPAAVLGLSPGVQSPLPDGEGHPLPPAEGVWSAEVGDGGATPWAAAAPPALRVARTVRCARYELVRVTIPGTSTYTSTTSFTFPILGIADGDGVIVAINDGRFFRVTPSGSEPLSVAPGTPYLAHYRAPDGELWLFGPGGALARGDFARGFEEMPSSPTSTGVLRAWLAGPRDPDAPFELYALDDSGAMARFSDGVWQSAGRVRRNGDEPIVFAGIQWVRPGEAFVVAETVDPGLRIRGTTPEEEEILPMTRTPSLRTLGWLPAWGLVAATHSARIFTRHADADEWTQLYDSPLTSGFSQLPKILAIAGLDEGMLVGGGLDGFTQYQPELDARGSRWCDYAETEPVTGLVPPEFLSAFVATEIVELPCGYALLSKAGAFDADVEISFLTRIP
ncbi:hypothetical protein L6R52_26630 [Myxococcota bacterium]|nr:hypothetical protein [Myxococcota bacterium]